MLNIQAAYKKLVFLFCLLFINILLINTSINSQTNPLDSLNPLDLPPFEDPPFWRQAMGGAVIAAPASQAGSVVMISDGGNIKAFSWQGTPLWDYFARGRLLPFITRSREGTSYVCRSTALSRGVLIAVNRSGRELWQINLGEPLTAPVLTGWDGRLFVFTESLMRCFTASGFQLWSMALEKEIALKPRDDGDGGFFLVLEDGQFLRVNAFGRIISEQLESIPLSIVPVGPAGERTSLLIVYASGVIEIYNTVNGNREILRGITLPARPFAAAGWNSYAAILLGNGRICLLSLENRNILWTGDTHLTAADFLSSGFETDLFIDERGIYLLTNNGASAFTEDGRRLWLIRLRGNVSVPAFSDEGILYSGGADWILYAYRLEERVRSNTQLLYGPAPPGNYGTGIRRPGLWSNYPNRFDERELDLWLREIGQAVQQGQVGEMEIEYASWLMEAAGSSVYPGLSEYDRYVFVPQKVRALNLLSFIGSMETVPFLVEVFTRERDPVVRAAAAQALGRIGVDPQGNAIRAFSNALFPPAPERNIQVLASIAAAAGAISRFSGPPLSASGVQILTALASYDRPPLVRSIAERELQTLR